ncbi:MAG: hypothetical protein COY80_01090 [Candidatus Pacebacteria bacterium CG_4_10_14_0_8_um_filter_42_14]|nr:MAG: hypothetical protein COY80_01090 [Candidatus Pacebacteria bacterium CG_4_10_14_0_8_um_filter_42_14]
MSKIRTFQPQDKDQLLNLLIESNLFQKSQIEKESINEQEVRGTTTKHFNDNIEIKDFNYFVAEDEGKLVGVIQVEVSSVYKGRGSIDDLYLIAEYRNQGLGKQLMKVGLVWLKEKGVKKVGLAVHKDNLAAVKLYESFGFEDEPDSYRSLELNL